MQLFNHRVTVKCLMLIAQKNSVIIETLNNKGLKWLLRNRIGNEKSKLILYLTMLC